MNRRIYYGFIEQNLSKMREHKKVGEILIQHLSFDNFA